MPAITAYTTWDDFRTRWPGDKAALTERLLTAKAAFDAAGMALPGQYAVALKDSSTCATALSQAQATLQTHVDAAALLVEETKLAVDDTTSNLAARPPVVASTAEVRRKDVTEARGAANYHSSLLGPRAPLRPEARAQLQVAAAVCALATCAIALAWAHRDWTPPAMYGGAARRGLLRPPPR